MKTIRVSIAISFLIGWSFIVKGQSTLELVESTTNGCGPLSDCPDSIICFRIILTPAVTSHVLSYNIWVNFPGTGLTYLSDAACITDDGNDNDEFLQLGYYRVSGVSGTMMVQQDVPIVLHSICFKFSDIGDFDGQDISVGGSLFGLLSTLTYQDPDVSEPDIPAFPLTLNESSVSCLDVLPIGLMSFDVVKQDKHALLRWSTRGGDDVASFEIQRSWDMMDFEILSTEPAQISSESEIVPYTFTDSNPAERINYYRLNEIYKDGRTAFSSIRSLVFDDRVFSMNVWPNPVSGNELYMEIPSLDAQGSMLRVFNMTGQEVLYQKVEPTHTHITLNIYNIVPGVYTATFDSGLNHFVKKFAIIR